MSSAAKAVAPPSGGEPPSSGGVPPLGGGVLISTRRNAVGWLAVATACRGQGLGRALLAHALAALDPAREVTVQTFAAGIAAGEAARALYRRFGFAERGPADPTPAGISTVLMVRPPRPTSRCLAPESSINRDPAAPSP